uniref:cell division protein SepF n=1 Tax=Ndongobacter massiliensis TaxID=1871025 RepID=UPI0009307E4E|nr:cell division protein SepF [Ndongobacter massiliensis]
MGFMDKLKNMIGIEDEYYDEDDYYGHPEESENAAGTEQAPTYTSTEPTRSSRSNVVSMATASGKMKISIQEPLTYEDGPQILDDIMAGKTVVLNIEMLEVDKKRQIFDFVSGGIYALGGSLQKVTKDIFVIVPKGVQIDGKIVDTMAKSSMYQL